MLNNNLDKLKNNLIIKDITHMIGYAPGRFWKLCWVVFTPTLCLVRFKKKLKRNKFLLFNLISLISSQSEFTVWLNMKDSRTKTMFIRGGASF